MAYYEVEGWPKELTKPNGEFVPERRVHGPWADRFLECGSLEDLESPYAPGCGTYVSHMQIEPFGAQTGIVNGLATYEKAEIHIWYSSKINTNAAIIEFITHADGQIPASPMQLFWTASGDSPIHERNLSYVMRSGCTFHHERKKLAIVPTAALTQVDYVNSSAFYSQILGITFAAETLRACVPRIERTYTVSGLTSFFVHQIFAYRSNGGLGWNSGYRADTGAFSYVYNANGNRVRDYPATNLTLV